MIDAILHLPTGHYVYIGEQSKDVYSLLMDIINHKTSPTDGIVSSAYKTCWYNQNISWPYWDQHKIVDTWDRLLPAVETNLFELVEVPEDSYRSYVDV